MEKELFPLVQRKLQEHRGLCKKHGITFSVTSTYRSVGAQNALYAQGRTKPGNIVTNAKGGQSFHNWRVAYDVVPVINGKISWSNEAIFSAIGYFGKKCGLEWGGDFGNIKDLPHFQLTLGYTFQDFINKKVDLTKFN
jgi:peptidoglycan L-alanyl-D-glutamate endopeptidase CwlK